MKHINVVLSAAGLALAAATCLSGQAIGTFSPERGFLPYGAYSGSGFGSVNEYSGNLNLSIPLASLPAGRGGMGIAVGLTYNSQIYDLKTQPGDGRTVTECPSQCPNPNQVNLLQNSVNGGWRYSYNYAINVENRPVVCSSSQPFTYLAVRLSMVLPDGSSHPMQQQGQADNGGDSYYHRGPDGVVFCSGTNLSNIGPIVRYYSTDGTYIQLTFDNSVNPATWTAVFPDGRTVSGLGVFGMRAASKICDPNSNCVFIKQRAYVPAGTGVVEEFPYTSIQEQDDPGGDSTANFGRAVRITYAISQTCAPDCSATTDYITQDGYLANMQTAPDQRLQVASDTRQAPATALKWTVSWTNVPVGNITPVQYDCQDSSGAGYNCLFSGGQRVVSKVLLPSGLSYSFLYADDDAPAGLKGWGELRRVVLPNGSATETSAASPTPRIDYQYNFRPEVGGQLRLTNAGAGNYIVSKTLTYNDRLRALDTTTAASTSQLWTYTYSTTAATPGTITFHPDGLATSAGTTQSNYFLSNCSGYDCAGLKSKTVMPEGTTIEQFWQANNPWNGTGKRNAFVRATYTTPAGGTTATAVVVSQDKNGNLTKRQEYDFLNPAARDASGIPTSGTVLRTTTNDYYYGAEDSATTAANFSTNGYWNNFGVRFKGAVLRSTVADSTGNLSASEFDYVDRLNIPNVKTEAHWDSSRATALPALGSQMTLDATNSAYSTRTWSQGNLLTETDPDLHVTSFTRGAITGCPSAYTNLYPTASSIGSGLRSTTFKYDCATGLVKNTVDTDNSSLTSISGYDIYGRQTSLSEAGGAQTTSTTFDDVNAKVMVSSGRITATDAGSKTVYEFDQLGQLYKTRSNGDSSTVTISGSEGIWTLQGDRYDSTNRYTLSSTPFSSLGEAGMSWHRVKYDKEGRSVESASLDLISGTGATTPKLPMPWGTADGASLGKSTTTYAGATVTRADAASNTNVATVDGIGRPTSVNSGGGLSVASYGYSGLTTTVTQTDTTNYSATKTQTRTMTYTSLGRLKSAENPENGKITYTYFAGGSLKTRTDARSAVMTIPSIDGLKRPSGKTYTGTGTSTVATTPNVTYCYDGTIYQSGGCASGTRGTPDYPKGQMTGYGSQVDGGDAAQNYLQIDALGRVLKSSQWLVSGASGTAAVEYPFVYTYQASGALSTVQYPISNRVVTYTQGSNRDLTTTVQSGTTQYLSGMTYTSQGAVKAAAMGSGVSQSFDYNGRGQLTGITAALGGSTMFGQSLTYGQSTSANNGNVASQTISAGAAGTFNQYYLYDSANRLAVAAEGAAPASTTACPGGVTWCHRYGFDGFSNIWQTQTSGTMTPVSLAQTGPSWYDPATNRLSGTNYDASGNQTQFPESGATARTASYDAENRLTTVAGTGSQASYFYDGEGRRVKKVVGTTTAYVYSSDGELMAEYGGTAAATSRLYLVQDHLGSTRVITDGSGACQTRLDYFPYGAAVPRTGSCYAADPGVTQQFTGKERDAETGLDYFVTRYYSGAQGRFSSPDSLGYDQRPWDPQSWNLYGYVRNSPLRYTDPDGRACVSDENGKEHNDKSGGQTCEDAHKDDKRLKPSETVTAQQGSLVGFLFSPPVARYVANDTPLDEKGQKVTRELSKRIDAYPTVCGGGGYVYLGKEFDIGAANAFAGTIMEYDSREGLSKGTLFEAGGGEGIVGGVGHAATTNGGQLAGSGLAYAGVGVHSPVAAASAGVVGFGSGSGVSGVGLYGEGFLFGRGGGVGGYVNLTNVGKCR